MKLSRFALVAALALTVTLPALAGDEPYDGAHFKRVTLVVSDLDRSLEIYRDILGFSLDGISESSSESYSYPVFKIDPDATIRFATLSAGPEQVRTMALTEVAGMDLPKPGVPFMTATVIRVDDLDGVFAKLEKLGLETVPGTVAERPGEFKFKERAFVDFDGHLVVLYQMLPLE
jgi:catechol 2,3-dioxygenase-like lactoylglutathione lyase family enzyme